MPRVSVIVVMYRSRDTISPALEVLRPAHEEGWLECIVVDNDSGDGGYEYVRTHHPWVDAVQSGANIGFGRANNLGLGRVSAPYVLFLNPDARIEPGAILQLVDFLQQHEHAGIVGPAIRNNGYPGQLAGSFPTPRSLLREALGRRPRAYFIMPGSPAFRADWVCGAVMLVRTRLLHQLGGFDPRFFLYFEETDLCRRARAAGVETWAVGEAVADHEPGSSTSREGRHMHHGCIADHFFRSRFYYLRKHYGWPRAVAVEAAEAVILLGRALRSLARRRGTGSLLTRFRGPLFSQPMPPRGAQDGTRHRSAAPTAAPTPPV